MAGKGGYRPGAGRPSLTDEQVRARVIDKCWTILEQYVDKEDVPLKEKLDVAKHIAGKSVPQNLNLAGELTHNVFMQSILAKSKGVAE